MSKESTTQKKKALPSASPDFVKAIEEAKAQKATKMQSFIPYINAKNTWIAKLPHLDSVNEQAKKMGGTWTRFCVKVAAAILSGCNWEKYQAVYVDLPELEERDEKKKKKEGEITSWETRNTQAVFKRWYRSALEKPGYTEIPVLLELLHMLVFAMAQQAKGLTGYEVLKKSDLEQWGMVKPASQELLEPKGITALFKKKQHTQPQPQVATNQAISPEEREALPVIILQSLIDLIRMRLCTSAHAERTKLTGVEPATLVAIQQYSHNIHLDVDSYIPIHDLGKEENIPGNDIAVLKQLEWIHGIPAEIVVRVINESQNEAFQALKEGWTYQNLSRIAFNCMPIIADMEFSLQQPYLLPVFALLEHAAACFCYERGDMQQTLMGKLEVDEGQYGSLIQNVNKAITGGVKVAEQRMLHPNGEEQSL